MTPLFACFPVCLTFVALAVVALLVVATGMVGPGPGASAETEHPGSDPAAAGSDHGPPPWWVVVLIFVGVLVHFVLLAWVWPEL